MQAFLRNTVGKKLLMSASGLAMVIFAIIHVIGNFTIFFGGLNAYAQKLHSMNFLIWAARAVLITAVSIHFILGILLYLENRSSKPGRYAVEKNLSAKVSLRTSPLMLSSMSARILNSWREERFDCLVDIRSIWVTSLPLIVSFRTSFTRKPRPSLSSTSCSVE